MPGNTTSHEAFTVQGLTGVDLSLSIAGTGSRSYAFVIDWHIRLLLALAWYAFSVLFVTGGLRLPDSPGVWSQVVVVLPAIAIYFLYHPIIELAMRGQSPGKRLAGVRVVDRDGGPPGVGAILIRNVFRLVDSLPLLYVVGLVTTMATAQHVRIGDMAAGTLLVTVPPRERGGLAGLAARRQASRLDPAALDLVEQLLERWQQLEPDKRQAIARELVKRTDPDAARAPVDMTEAELHARLTALAGGAGPA
jgi:uncharacterized RDD family membrane protein YckC